MSVIESGLVIVASVGIGILSMVVLWDLFQELRK